MTVLTSAAEKESSFLKLVVVFAVLFFDFLAFAAVIPLIPLLIFEPQNGLLPMEFSLKFRCLVLGGLYSVYPLAQMLFSPLLGSLSDKFGRKSMLLTAYLGNAIGYFLFGMGIYTHEILLLFLGYFLAGATGCNLSTTNTIIADLCSNEKKLQSYSFSNIMMGLAFVLGPLLTGHGIGKFPNVSQLAFFSFLCCCLLSLANALAVHRYFKSPKQELPSKNKDTASLKSVLKKDKRLLFILSGTFLLFLGWYSFIKFFQALFLNTPDFKDMEIFSALSYFGVCCVISQLLFSLTLHKMFNGKRHILLFGALLALSIFATAFVNSYLSLMIAITLFSFAYSVLCPCLMYEVSEFGSKETSGRIMGLYQSVQDLAKILAPLLAGYTMAFWNKGPALIASGFILCSLFVFYFEKRSVKRMCTEQDSNL